jgi:hypothetical protein
MTVNRMTFTYHYLDQSNQIDFYDLRLNGSNQYDFHVDLKPDNLNPNSDPSRLRGIQATANTPNGGGTVFNDQVNAGSNIDYNPQNQITGRTMVWTDRSTSPITNTTDTYSSYTYSAQLADALTGASGQDVVQQGFATPVTLRGHRSKRPQDQLRQQLYYLKPNRLAVHFVRQT